MNRRTKIAGAAVGVAALVALGITQLGGGDDDDDGDKAGQPGATGEPGVLTAEGLAYDFDTLTVAPGELITFRNGDTIAHTLTADDGLFDSGSIEPGGTWVTSYDGPRTIDVHCDIHPSMQATIVIEGPE